MQKDDRRRRKIKMNDKKIFDLANSRFLSKELSLIESDVSERCICASLKGYLEKEIEKYSKYKKYHVDVEYNRNAGHVKTIINSDFKVIQVTCDLIIHSRGEDEKNDNLIALEMKKSYQSEEKKNADRERLIALTRSEKNNDVWSFDGKTFPRYVCGYKLGIYYEIDLPNRIILIEYYRGGNLVGKDIKRLKN